ncbi:hypothetical protein HDU76_009569 [Blyttiomyces sp. JEL0837]|nr:hypothetical protein HDU76_009569 [Blyttiomyces sp. JEL0837]
MSALGSVYDKIGQYEQSEVLKVEVLARFRETFGNDHSYTAIMLNNVSSLYTKMGHYDKAEPFILEALEIRKRISGPNHKATLVCARTLGTVYQKQNKRKEAQEIFIDAWTRLKENLGSVAEIYIYLEAEFDEYEEIITDYMERTERVFGSEHVDTLIAHRLYGTLLNKQGKYEKSVEVLTDILAKLKKMNLESDDGEESVAAASVLEASLNRRQAVFFSA